MPDVEEVETREHIYSLERVGRSAFDASVEREITPLGLVATDDGWNLVFQDAGRLYVLSLADILPLALRRSIAGYAEQIVRLYD